jgi:uncharacterized protein (TIGR03067 family)
MNLRIGLSMIVLALAVSGCGKPDYEVIQGRWYAVSFKVDGVDKPHQEIGIELTNGRWTNLKNGEVDGSHGDYRIDEKRSPKWIDVTDNTRNLQLKGIYELKGEKLRICFNEKAKTEEDRPTAFESTAGSPNQVLLEFVRKR